MYRLIRAWDPYLVQDARQDMKQLFKSTIVWEIHTRSNKS